MVLAKTEVWLGLYIGRLFLKTGKIVGRDPEKSGRTSIDSGNVGIAKMCLNMYSSLLIVNMK